MSDYEKYIVNGEFPYHRNYVDTTSKLLSTLKSSFNITNAPYTIKTICDPRLMTVSLKNPSSPMLVYNNMIQYYSAIDDPKYIDGDVLTDLFSEEERVKANFRTFPSPLQWWSDSNNRKIIGDKLDELTQKFPNKSKVALMRERITEIIKEPRQFPIRLAMLAITKLFEDPTTVKWLDFSSGWGDRLIAACVCNVEMYVGIDPNKNLIPCYEKIKNFFAKNNYLTLNSTFEDFDETVMPKVFMEENKIVSLENYFDITLTSPPYYEDEHYTDDESQSDIKFKTLNEWKAGFLIPAIKKSIFMTKKTGYIILHIGNRKYQNIVSTVFEQMNQNRCLYLGCISRARIGTKTNDRRPLFVWKKLM